MDSYTAFIAEKSKLIDTKLAHVDQEINYLASPSFANAQLEDKKRKRLEEVELDKKHAWKCTDNDCIMDLHRSDHLGKSSTHCFM